MIKMSNRSLTRNEGMSEHLWGSLLVKMSNFSLT